MWSSASARSHSILGVPHTAQTRVDLFSQGEPLASEVPFESGSVTDTQVVAGQRRSLSLTVADDRWWQEWITKPALEIRPHGGVSLGQGHAELFPLGVFELQRRPKSLVPGTMSLAASDRWGSRVAPNGFLTDRWARTDLTAAKAVGYLIGLSMTPWSKFPIDYEITQDTRTPAALWKDKMQVIGDLVKSFDGESWFDRVGAAVIRNKTYGEPVVTIRPGVGGTLAEANADVDLGPLLNRVSVGSSNSDVKFTPVIATIGNPSHPAHESKVGIRAKAFTSASLKSRGDAGRMARGILRRTAAWGRQVSGSMVPDFALDAGDAAWLQWDADGLDKERVTFQSLTTPLGPGMQSFQTVATPEEFDVE